MREVDLLASEGGDEGGIGLLASEGGDEGGIGLLASEGGGTWDCERKLFAM